MRLGIIRQRYTPFGGAERFAERAIDALLERGVRVSVYTRRWPQARTGRIEPVICDPFFIGNLWRDVSFARAVRGALARDRPDLVQSHERIEGCDVFRAGDGLHRVWLEERVRTSGWQERLRVAANPYHRYVLDAEARVFASSSLKAVICISQMVRDDIRRHFSVDEKKLSVIYNAVDPREFGPQVRAARASVRASLGFTDDHVVFLLVGSGYARKGVPTAVRALARLPAHARLVIVGRDKALAFYRGLARRSGVGDRVVFAGPQRDPGPFYGAADAFVLPTVYDPLSNAVLEALACGLPVVTSRRCGAGELVVAGGAGWVCDAIDDAAFGDHMRRLLDPGERERIARLAAASVAALTPDAMSRNLLELYQSLLGFAASAATETR
ncbi:MAG TPA: glycosyltransferase family 4 protein [Casimicrobiaceae bacterium]|jgi:UDP-glucose:(heptosyl)LPS alpha-1,3-glucosyltransferase|nr:glycosyltransferase family 4 protein [Casimicrobiaceae bacterium]